MNLLSQIAIAIVAILHLYTLYIEMFAWETKGKRIFKGILPENVFTPVKPLAANIGLYNGFLSAGLLWTFFISDAIWKTHIAMFFLGFIIIAGVYGSITGPKSIFFFQALPAVFAMAILLTT